MTVTWRITRPVTRTTTKAHRFAVNGSRIRRARRRAGISQEGLALKVGTTRRHMIRLENGEHLPSTPLRNRIAAEVGVDPSAIQASDEDDEESDTVRSLDEFLELRVRQIWREQQGARL